jgi:hypothetical protein
MKGRIADAADRVTYPSWIVLTQYITIVRADYRNGTTTRKSDSYHQQWILQPEDGFV